MRPLAESLLLFLKFNTCDYSGCFICRWKVDGREIHTESEPNYSLIEGNLLINNPHVTDHGGVYQCIATNSFGTVVSREAKVQFACKWIFKLSFSSSLSFFNS